MSTCLPPLPLRNKYEYIAMLGGVPGLDKAAEDETGEAAEQGLRLDQPGG